jgi:hypothetical protein
MFMTEFIAFFVVGSLFLVRAFVTRYSGKAFLRTCSGNFCCIPKSPISEPRRGPSRGLMRKSMNLEIWIPAMFLLGVVSMGLCYLFMKACEKI